MGILRKNKFAFLRYLLFFLFVGYYGSITLFYHVHVVNGQLVTHSHPFKKNSDTKFPIPKHNHVASVYNLIQQLSETNWENTSGHISIPGLSAAGAGLLWYKAPCKTSSTVCICPSLRAPPVA